MTEPAADADRERRARLANMRQELLAPVTALVGYGELLTEEAERLELGRPRARSRAHSDRRARPARAGQPPARRGGGARQASRADLDAIQAKMRHDLRNPLNAIKGYAELLLEELDELGGAALRADLEALLGESESLLARIDVIVDFSRGADGAELACQDEGARRQHGRQSGPDRQADRGARRAGRRRPGGSWWSTTTPATAICCFAACARDGHQVTRAEFRAAARSRSSRSRSSTWSCSI